MPPPPPPPPPKTFRVERSGVLDRARAFLPAMAAANEETERKIESEGASSVVVEAAEDAEGPHVEMDVACGVLEAEPRAQEPTPEDVERNTEEFLFGAAASGKGKEEKKKPLVVAVEDEEQ